MWTTWGRRRSPTAIDGTADGGGAGRDHRVCRRHDADHRSPSGQRHRRRGAGGARHASADDADGAGSDGGVVIADCADVDGVDGQRGGDRVSGVSQRGAGGDGGGAKLHGYGAGGEHGVQLSGDGHRCGAQLVGAIGAGGGDDDGAGGGDAGAVFTLTLDAGSGTTAPDSSGNGNHGTLVNGPTWTPGAVFGGVAFDGSNDTIEVPASATVNAVSTRVTVAAGRTARARKRGGYRCCRGSGGRVPESSITWGSARTRSVGGEHDGGVFEPVAGGRGAGGAGGHLVGTYDGTTVRLYVNGVEAFATAHTGSFVSDAAGVTVGGAHNDGTGAVVEAFAGKVDEVRLYGRGLSASEVVALYTGAAPAAPDCKRRRCRRGW